MSNTSTSKEYRELLARRKGNYTWKPAESEWHTMAEWRMIEAIDKLIDKHTPDRADADV